MAKRKRNFINILGWTAIILLLVFYKHLERSYDDYWAVATAISLSILIGGLWRFLLKTSLPK